VWEQVAVLDANETDIADAFGRAVAIDGDVVVVGAPERQFRNESDLPGAAYVFERDPELGTWSQTVTIQPEPIRQTIALGRAVSTEGGHILISGGGEDGGVGHVVVFSRQGTGAWVSPDTLSPRAFGTAGDVQINSQFGSSLGLATATDGRPIAIVGAVSDDGGSSNSVYNVGRALVYARGDDGRWAAEAELAHPDTLQGDDNGWSVAIAAGHGPDRTAVAVVSAIGGAGPAGRTGAVHVYVRDGAGQWTHEDILTADDAVPGDQLGWCTALARTERGHVVISSARNDWHSGLRFAGSAYVFVRDTADAVPEWRQVAKLIASDAVETQYFGALTGNDGHCTAISESGMGLVGSTYSRRSGWPNGSVYAYDLSAWVPVVSENTLKRRQDMRLEVVPNPVRQLARITYALATPAAVRLSVHDTLGREVAVLRDTRQLDGEHMAEWTPDGLAAGVYLVRLRAGDEVRTRRMTVVR
ncbi:MAG: T9SS type A sorting domain-containing protein, partial [Bacteroidota bacterium]